MSMTNPLTDEDLKAIRERAEAATEGPWEVQDGCSWRRIGRRHPDGTDGDVLCPYNCHRDNHPDLFSPDGKTYENLEFIAHARTDIPRLLDEIERLRAKVPHRGKVS